MATRDHGRRPNPPLLTGGLTTLQIPNMEAMGVGVDFLTLSVPEPSGASLLADTMPDEDGTARAGFRRSEKRLCLGGHCWRRWEPHQASGTWGTQYESWEWSGPESGWAADRCRSLEGRPSRVDVAWDFPTQMTSDELANQLLVVAEPRGFTDGISGQNGVNTRYIGGKQSERRLRIYRKDLEDLLWAEIYGPTLRVELVMKNETAHAWWPVWCRSRDEGFAAAAAHCDAMTGWAPQREVGEVPESVPVEGLDEAASLFAFLQQHGPTLAAFEQAGVPVLELARDRVQQLNRHSASRYRRRVRSIREVGADRLVQLVGQMLRKPSPAMARAAS